MAVKKPKGLGMGLEALLGPRVKDVPKGDSAFESKDQVQMLRLADLSPGKYQPRTHMDEGALYELAESIKSQGVMQPILVRPLTTGGFEIIAGERRSRAAKLAGLAEVPVLIKDVADEVAAVMALIENIQREDLNPLEEAQGLQRLVQEFGLTHDKAAQAVGRSRSAASNLLRLLQLAQPVQAMLMAGDIDMGHARALLALDKVHQITVANEVVSKKLSVRDTERLVQQRAQGVSAASATAATLSRSPAAPEHSGDVRRLEASLSDWLTAPVDIRIKRTKRQGEQGEIAIGFGSLNELNGLLERLGAPVG